MMTHTQATRLALLAARVRLAAELKAWAAQCRGLDGDRKPA